MKAESKNISVMFEEGVAKFVDEMAVLSANGLIGMTGIGSRKAPCAALVVSGHPGVKLFEKLMEIAPTLPEYREMIESAEAESERIRKLSEED